MLTRNNKRTLLNVYAYFLKWDLFMSKKSDETQTLDFKTVFKLWVNELYFLFVDVLIKKKLMMSLVIRLLQMWLANYCKEPESKYDNVGYIFCHNHDSKCFLGIRAAINGM